MDELRAWLIAIIPTLVGAVSFISTQVKVVRDNRKFTAQVKKEANTDEIKQILVEMKCQLDRQAKRYSDIEAENAEIKKQYNRLLSEVRGVRYDEQTTKCNNQKI